MPPVATSAMDSKKTAYARASHISWRPFRELMLRRPRNVRFVMGVTVFGNKVPSEIGKREENLDAALERRRGIMRNSPARASQNRDYESRRRDIHAKLLCVLAAL